MKIFDNDANEICISKDNSTVKKIKLVFCEFLNEKLKLTCSYDVLNENDSHLLTYFINNKPFNPCTDFVRHIIIDNDPIAQMLFSIEIPIEYLKNNKTEILFKIDGQDALLEYGKYFPLNENVKSYFAYKGIVLYRKNKSLMIEKNSFFKKVKFELSYLNSLIRSKNKKFAFVRLCYFLTKNFVPKNIWLIADRPEVAGDNGESLFRHIRTHKYKNINAYFVIDKNSKDYQRLKKFGHVIPMSSRKHKFFALHSSVTAVSQTNYEVFEVFNRNFLKDLLYKENRVFLQHGIIKDDLSNLYSRFDNNFNLFVTSATQEYEYIINNKNYGCGKSVTKLTGLPRHDNLYNNTDKIIVINPTWRFYLWKISKDEFEKSLYFKKWNEILKNKHLNLLLKKTGYKIVFVLHHNLEKFSECFYHNENIEIPISKNYSEIFSKGALFVTDYSSNAFEFAYLRKPLIYFQFDKETFYTNHTYKKGISNYEKESYFNFEKNGFGEVAYTLDKALDYIFSYISLNCKLKKEYEQRINYFFKFNDGNNSKRVVEQILKLER